jgi:hypothetical protein
LFYPHSEFLVLIVKLLVSIIEFLHGLHQRHNKLGVAETICVVLILCRVNTGKIKPKIPRSTSCATKPV